MGPRTGASRTRESSNDGLLSRIGRVSQLANLDAAPVDAYVGNRCFLQLPRPPRLLVPVRVVKALIVIGGVRVRGSRG
jgi:hypothetical protein